MTSLGKINKYDDDDDNRNRERLGHRLGLGYGKPKIADCKQLD